jgi:adenylyltransferase/sulfurtransferase
LQKQITEEEQLLKTINDEFIVKNKISGEFSNLLSFLSEGNFTALIKNKQLVFDFTDAAINYYKNLDDSLQVKSIVKEITATQLKELMDNNSNIQLIDVLEAWEKEIADIGGQLIPLSTIDSDSHKILNDRQTIIYCRTGRRSAEAINLLAKKQNTDNFYNLKGGIYSWADEIDNSMQKY